ncbi:MAG TPA: hypothetical protein VK993_13095 [Chthoniobacterales bacterium]|nr:hypothetical protein [Chthoniobacterales bacterium]
MKPTFQFPDTRSLRGACIPKTDYCFRPSMRDFGGRSRGEGEPSFRRISGAYFESEARSHFATEAGFFALIVLTAAFPVAKAISGLFQFVYAVGGL